MSGVNRVVLLGTIGKYGPEVRYSPTGTACTSFMLVIPEHGQDGKWYSTLVPCEVWGKKAEAASELEAGALVLFEGKLAKRKRGEQWELVVSGPRGEPDHGAGPADDGDQLGFYVVAFMAQASEVSEDSTGLHALTQWTALKKGGVWGPTWAESAWRWFISWALYGNWAICLVSAGLHGTKRP